MLAELSLSRKNSIAFGTTSVTVKLDIVRSNNALVLCGPNFCRLEFTSNDRATPNVYRIWLNDRIQTAYQQSCIQSIAQIELQSHLRTSGLVGSLVCISGTELIIAVLDEGGPRVVPRRIPVGGTPNRMIFSRYLNKLIVSYTRLEVKVSRQTNGHHRSTAKRSLCPTIQFLDPDEDMIKHKYEGSPDDAKDPLKSVRELFPVGKAGEKVLAMLGTSINFTPGRDPVEQVYANHP